MPVLPRDNGLPDGARTAIYILAAVGGLFCISFLYYYAKESRYEQSEQRDFQWRRVLISTAKFSTLIGLVTWTYHQIEYNRNHPSRRASQRLCDTTNDLAPGVTTPEPAYLRNSNNNNNNNNNKSDEKRGPRARGRSRTRADEAARHRSTSSRTVTEMPTGRIEPVLGGSAESYYVEAQMALAQELHEITRQPEQPASGGPMYVLPCDSKQAVYEVDEKSR